MYFDDLEPCNYSRGAFHTDDWAVPLLAVGWLEYPCVHERGPTPSGLLERLEELEAESELLRGLRFMGLHRCSLCYPAPHIHKLVSILPDELLDEIGIVRARPQPTSPESLPCLRGSNVVLLIPAKGVVYCAPARIDHYIREHEYLPPSSFVDAVFACPPRTSREYHDALGISDGKWGRPDSA